MTNKIDMLVEELKALDQIDQELKDANRSGDLDRIADASQRLTNVFMSMDFEKLAALVDELSDKDVA